MNYLQKNGILISNNFTNLKNQGVLNMYKYTINKEHFMISNKSFASGILPLFYCLLILDINALSMITIFLVMKMALLLLFL